MNFSGAVVGRVGSVQFQIVPCSSLARSNVVGVNYRDFNLLHLSLPKRFSLYLASNVCRSPQCLTCALTQGGEGGRVFRLTCSSVLWGRRGTAGKSHWLARVGSARSVCATLGLCVCFPRLRCSGSGLLRREWALGCVHFPGLSHSGARVLHKGADSVGPAFCAFPWSEGPWRPGAWGADSPQVRRSHHLPGPSRWVSRRASLLGS